jgi:hypothetical protein
MAAKISITRNFSSLPDLKLVSKEDMREIGLLARERIITRTLRGQSVDGGAFAPYSAGYADLKRSAAGTSQVNLQVSGNMLNQMGIVDLTDDSVTLGWTQ